MRRLLALLLALVATTAGARVFNFAWDAGTGYPLGTTYELRANGISASGITGLSHSLDVPLEPGGTLYAGVRAIPPAGYQCGAPPVDCGPSNWVTLTAVVPRPIAGLWATKSLAMATAPSIVTSGQTAWNTNTSPKTTANFNVLTGDIIVAFTAIETNVQVGSPPGGTLAGTWSVKENYLVGNKTGLQLWTLVSGADQTGVNISFSVTTSKYWGGGYVVLRGSDGVGVVNIADSTTGTPAVTLSGVTANSAIVMINGDWAAVTGARTYHTTDAGTFSEIAYYADGSRYGAEGGYYADVGAAGNKVVGIDAPTGMNWVVAAVEILGHTSIASGADIAWIYH